MRDTGCMCSQYLAFLFYLLGEIMAKYAAITGWGMAVPERVLTNAELERMVSTSDEWIRTRTGIRERRVVGPGESTSTLSTAAGRQAIDGAFEFLPKGHL